MAFDAGKHPVGDRPVRLPGARFRAPSERWTTRDRGSLNGAHRGNGRGRRERHAPGGLQAGAVPRGGAAEGTRVRRRGGGAGRLAAQAAPFHLPKGRVGLGRTFPPQMKAAMRGRRGAEPSSPRVMTIPRSGRRGFRVSWVPGFMDGTLVAGD